MALRKGARAKGAEIHEQTEVTGATRTASGEWRLTTTKGEITCEHVVCATGNYARQTGRMFGLEVPAIPVEHQYIVYEESPELAAYRKAGGRELAVLREPDESYYLREERLGWILGPYEKHAPACFADGVPPGFEKDLFPGDLERIMVHVEAAMRRVPSLEKVGIKQIVNGPISYTPAGNPMVGPAFGIPREQQRQAVGIVGQRLSGCELACMRDDERDIAEQRLDLGAPDAARVVAFHGDAGLAVAAARALLGDLRAEAGELALEAGGDGHAAFVLRKFPRRPCHFA